jgi:hypothetical protein
MWYDMDFAYDPAGKPLVACVPNATNGNFGQLQVWWFDDAYPANALDHAVVESEGIYNASLLLRKNGIADLFYLKVDSLHLIRHRRSRDGGRTWEGMAILDVGLNAASVAAQAGSLIGWAHGHNHLPVCYQEESGQLLMLLSGYRTKAPPAAPNLYAVLLLVVLREKDDESGWEITGNREAWNTREEPAFAERELDDEGVNYRGASGSPASPLGLQPLRHGRVLISPTQRTLQNVTAAGGFQVLETQATDTAGEPQGVLYARRCWIDERVGMAVAVSGWSFEGVPPGIGFANVWDVSIWNGSRWSVTGAYPRTYAYHLEDYQKTVRGWYYNYVTNTYEPEPPSTPPTGGGWVYSSLAHCLKVRQDGIWEMLRPSLDGSLQFARCRVMPGNAVTTWENR